MEHRQSSRPDGHSTNWAEVLGFTIAAGSPVRQQHLRIHSGLNALFGRNGVGKTILLREVERLLAQNAWNRDEPGSDYPSVSTAEAFYSMGGVHLLAPITRAELFDDDEPVNPIAQAARDWIASDPLSTGRDRLNVWSLDPVSRELISPLKGAGFTQDGIVSLLEQGRWMWQPRAEVLYLCDHQPLRGSSSDQWLASAESWASEFSTQTPLPGVRNGQLSWEDHDDEFGFCWRFPGISLRGPSSRSPLMPLPETLGVEWAPEWVGYPVVALPDAPRIRLAVLTDGIETSAKAAPGIWSTATERTVRTLPQHFSRKHVDFWNSTAPGAVAPIVHVDDAIEQISLAANAVMSDLFDEAPSLRLRRRPETDWYAGLAPIIWEARATSEGPWISAEELGAGHQRYANFAIERAINHWQRSRIPRIPANSQLVDLGTIALLDEPERALHVLAERHLAAALGALADFVLFSTHSTEFFDAAGESQIELRQNAHGNIEIHPVRISLNPDERRVVANRLGITPARLAALTNVYLLVEGVHDRAVIEAFNSSEIERSRAKLLELGGTKDLARVVLSDFLFDSTDAPIAICLDNVNANALDASMDQLRQRQTTSQRHGYLDSLRNDERFHAPEMKQLVELLRAAVRAERLDRIVPLGLSKRDIVEYLPVRAIDPRFESWKALNVAFLKAQGRSTWRPGDGLAKKNWVNANGGRYKVPGIRQALSVVAASGIPRHRDFDALGQRLLDLARR